jgi:hypothetical protein
MTMNEMPPVPQGLRDMLKDYPEHIERLQQALNWVVERPASGIPAFERAVWALEGRTETFITEARDELERAEQTGDPEEISRAKKKELLMLHSRSTGSWKMKDLLAYFDARKHEVGHGQ